MTNIVKNGSFTEGLRHWQTIGDWSVNTEGVAQLNLNQTQSILIQSEIQIMPDHTYSFQYAIRHIGTSGLSVIMKVSDNISNEIIYQSIVTAFDTEYQTISGIFHVPNNIELVRLTFEVYYLGDEPEQIYLDNIVIFHYQICFRSDSLVLTQDGPVKANELDPTYHLVYRTDTLKFVPLKIVVDAGNTINFFKLSKGLFGPDQPKHDLFITSGHRIIYQGNETKVRDIPGRKRIKLSHPDHIYTLVCQDHCPVMVNGIGVIAYGLEEWKISRMSMITSNLVEKMGIW
jgi:hypothetical protein